MTETEKQIAAHHEAGHAVSRMALGLGFRWVSVGHRSVIVRYKDGETVYGSFGGISGAPRGLKRLNEHAAQRKQLPPDLVVLAERWIVSCLAGPFAEMVAGGGQLLSPCSADDDLEVVAFLRDALGLDETAIELRFWPEAKDLVETTWPAVELVAEALVERSPRSLSYRQVDDIVFDATHFP